MKQQLRVFGMFLLISGLFGGLAITAHAADPAIIHADLRPVEEALPPRLEQPRHHAGAGNGDWGYYDRVEGGIRLWEYTGSAADVIVPSTVDGYTVVALYQSFFGNTAVQSVQLPSTVTQLGTGCFYNCTALRRVTGGQIRELGEFAFSGCSSLTVIPTLQEGMTILPKAAFQSCIALESLSIPSSVSMIGDYALLNCSSLQSMTLPSGLKSIGYAALYNCSSIAALDVPDSVSEIGSDAFSNGTMLIVGEGSYAQRWCAEYGYMCTVRGSTDLTKEIAPGETNVTAKVNAIVSTLITGDMDDYHKALILHDYLILHSEYDQSYSRHAARDILIDGLGVCQAYTEAYELLLRRAGLSCDREYGDDHIWNMVCIDGDWVHIDCTWDDPIVSGGGHAETHDFFGVTNFALEGVSSHECYNKPHIATSVAHSYAYQMGVIPQKTAEMREEVANLVNGGEFHRSLVDVFTGGDLRGVLSRMIYQGRDLSGITWKGYKVSFQTDYSSQDQAMRFDAYVNVPASATLVLPEKLKTLQTESFSGVSASRIVFPASVSTIGKKALPSGTVVIEAPTGSYALEYAEANGIPWQYKP